MTKLACGCVLGSERCFDCRYGLDPDQQTALNIGLAQARHKQMTKPASMSVAKYRQTLAEHDLQASVLDYLRLNRARGVFAFAIPNAAKRSPWQAARMKREGLLSGVADVCVMMDHGRTGWLEFKTVKGGQSVAQQEFEAGCLYLSHHYALCRDLPDAINTLTRWGALK